MNNFGDHFFTEFSNKFKSFEGADVCKDNHIYYLHGALFLYSDGINTLKRVRDTDGWLLNVITEEIKLGNYPLFISEGSSENKMKSIKSNTYLSFCMNKFETTKDDDTLVIFGQSLREQDIHITKLIDKNYKKVAISIRVEDFQNINELTSEIHRISSLIKKAEIDFFDSKSLFDFNPIDKIINIINIII